LIEDEREFKYSTATFNLGLKIESKPKTLCVFIFKKVPRRLLSVKITVARRGVIFENNRKVFASVFGG
jgi:hypothetical protein